MSVELSNWIFGATFVAVANVCFKLECEEMLMYDDIESEES